LMGYPAYVSSVNNAFALAGVSLTVSTADPALPGSNALIMPISKPHRFTTDAGSYTFNLGAGNMPLAWTPLGLVLVNHNLTAAATVRVQAGPTTGYATLDVYMTWRAQTMYLKITTAGITACQYWKITIADALNPADYVQVGYLLLGPFTTLAFAPAYDWTFSDEIVNARKETTFGTPLIAHLFNRISLELPFVNLSDTDMATLRNFVLAHDGDKTPLLWIPDSAAVDCYFGRFVNPTFQQRIPFYRSMTLQFREDSLGRDLD